jgi:hypothetical protein
MLPVIYVTLPTLVGVGTSSVRFELSQKTDILLALMIGFNNTAQKGVLLFGEPRTTQLKMFNNNMISSIIPHRHVWKHVIHHLRV